MSPRVVYFGQNMIYWECWQSRACEINPENLRTAINQNMDLPSLDQAVVSSPNKLKFKPLLEDLDSHSLANEHEECLFHWGFIIAKYSQCALKRPSDRLVAIQGLVHHFQPILRRLRRDKPVRSLAGHWECTLPKSLLWSASYKSRKFHGIAPSWSWASVEFASVNPDLFKAPRPQDVMHCAFFGIESRMDDCLDLGSRADIVLRLQAPILCLHLACFDLDDKSCKIKDVSITALTSRSQLRLYTADLHDAMAWYDEEQCRAPEEVLALPILTTMGTNSHKLELLLLTKHGQQFKRIGVAKLWLAREQDAATWLTKQASDCVMLL